MDAPAPEKQKFKPDHPEAFFMVWSPQGAAPTKRHATHKGAMGEAHRLAKLAPEAEFFVLRGRGDKAIKAKAKLEEVAA